MNSDAIEMEIDVLLGDLLGEPRDVPQLRTRIGDLILRSVPGVARQGTYWAKSRLVYACRAYSDNTRASARSLNNPARPSRPQGRGGRRGSIWTETPHPIVVCACSRRRIPGGNP